MASTCLLLCTLLLALVYILPQVQSLKCYVGEKNGKEIDCAEFRRKEIEILKAEGVIAANLRAYDGWCTKTTGKTAGTECGCVFKTHKDECIEENGITECCCKGDLCNAAGNLGASPVMVLILWGTVAAIGKGLML